MDDVYDVIRAVRDKRFKYIRNLEAHKPYAQPIDYLEKMPTMRVWRAMAAEGTLEGPQTIFFEDSKPDEELYDIKQDPHEIHNLAESPEHEQVLRQMRGALDGWMEKTADLGLVPESVLLEQWRPGGVWSKTEAPDSFPQGGRYGQPISVELRSATEGATVVFTTGLREEPVWKLYTDPILLEESTTLSVKAGRLGP